MSKVFLYCPEESSACSEISEELKYIIPENKNKTIMIDEGMQTEPKYIELDESPEKNYKILKEDNIERNNIYLNKKRK